ncbi:hypothetical protein [uncultured Microbacterium sp.]|uniref:MarR family winged helix-turn-helix transcriptional regulator n=1 Tax=uncultured Microbacterium sp. TaxID=191216 RepID=UPI00262275AE|nr:hypothetical protein [uncultured Microbacterium sp.]
MNTTDTHPFGYWITAVDRLMRAEFATVFEDEGITRRDWRMLNRLDGTVADDRPLRGPKLRRLVELGWVQRTRDGWELTDAGTLAKQRLSTAVDELRARVAGAVSPEEYATMTASLEKIAREFGWAEGKPLPRRERRGHRHGFGGRGHGHAFGRRGHHGFRRDGFERDRFERDGFERDGFERDRGYGLHGDHGHEGHRDHGFHDHGRRPGADPRLGDRFGERGDGHRDFGPHARRGHGFHRHMTPTTHVHIHTHG